MPPAFLRKGRPGRVAQRALPVMLAAALLLAVRSLLLMQVGVGEGTAVRGMERGDRALVSLTWYGLRLPGERFYGYHRLGYAVPQGGEAVAYRAVGGSDLRVGVCRAVLADTTCLLETAPGTVAAVPHEELVGRLVFKVFPNGWRFPWFERVEKSE